MQRVLRSRLGATDPRALHALRAGDLDAVLVDDLYDRETLARVAAGLEQPAIAARREPRDHPDPAVSQVSVIGEPISPSMLVPAGPPLERYLARADEFRALCRELFAPAPPFFERALEALSGLAGVPGALPAAGRPYGWGTFRHVPPGSGLDLHCEGLYADIEALAPIATVAALEETFSLFMPIAAPERGGVLEIFGCERPGGDEPPALRLEPIVGQLVVFAGGPRYHRVTPVEGDRARSTVGAFAAFARDGTRIYAWG